MKQIFLGLLASVLCSLVVSTSPAYAQGTALTFQGHLQDGSRPASGTYDFQFTVRDALKGGNAVGGKPLAVTLEVSNGLFTATLDPGAGVFTGGERWLEIAVRGKGAAFFTALSPLQRITATPYAITAGSAARLACPPGMVLIPDGGFTMGNSTGDLDIAGNVFEWCWDWFSPSPYAGGTDPRGPASGTSRVCRGGYWNSGASVARCARRSTLNPVNAYNTVGLRSVLPPGP